MSVTIACEVTFKSRCLWFLQEFSAETLFETIFASVYTRRTIPMIIKFLESVFGVNFTLKEGFGFVIASRHFANRSIAMSSMKTTQVRVFDRFESFY